MKAADEVHVTAEPIELRDDHRRLGFAGGFQGRMELRPLLIIIFTGLHLGECLHDLNAFLIGEALDQCLLRLKAQAALPLLANANVGDCGLHEGLLHNTTELHVKGYYEVLQSQRFEGWIKGAATGALKRPGRPAPHG
jgi:hypothetical protein